MNGELHRAKCTKDLSTSPSLPLHEQLLVNSQYDFINVGAFVTVCIGNKKSGAKAREKMFIGKIIEVQKNLRESEIMFLKPGKGKTHTYVCNENDVSWVDFKDLTAPSSQPAIDKRGHVVFLTTPFQHFLNSYFIFTDYVLSRYIQIDRSDR